MFHKLETHAREIRDLNGEQWERILLSAKAVKEYSGTDLKEETISTFFAKVSCAYSYLASVKCLKADMAGRLISTPSTSPLLFMIALVYMYTRSRPL